MEITLVAAGGAIVVSALVRRLFRSLRSQINIAPVSDQWLAEQKLSRRGWS